MSIFIDNIAFCDKSEHLEGQILLTDLRRLREFLAAKNVGDTDAANIDLKNADIRFVLKGELDALGRRLLHLGLIVNLMTSCQRCLLEMPLKVELNFDYLISNAALGPEATAEIQDDDFDLQEPSQSMDLSLLIEDEIIMAFPIAPVHDYDCVTSSMESGERLNPFAVLKGLVKF